jgi:hypothetical protein
MSDGIRFVIIPRRNPVNAFTMGGPTTILMTTGRAFVCSGRPPSPIPSSTWANRTGRSCTWRGLPAQGDF